MPAYLDILSYPDTPGFAFSWSSVEISIAGIKKVVATKSIKYTDGLSFGEGWGTGGRRLIRGRGQLNPTGTWEVYRSSWDMIVRDALAIIGKRGFSEAVLPIFVSYAEPSNPLLTVLDSLLGVRIHSPEAGGSEGTELLTVSLQLNITEIHWGAPGLTQLAPSHAVIPSP